MDAFRVFNYTILIIMVIMMLIDTQKKWDFRTRENLWEKMKAIIATVLIIILIAGNIIYFPD